MLGRITLRLLANEAGENWKVERKRKRKGTETETYKEKEQKQKQKKSGKKNDFLLSRHRHP